MGGPCSLSSFPLSYILLSITRQIRGVNRPDYQTTKYESERQSPGLLHTSKTDSVLLLFRAGCRS